ncbi:MAG: hypothetical protein ACYDHU_03505 [Acidimicrobiales bacterium]
MIGRPGRVRRWPAGTDWTGRTRVQAYQPVVTAGVALLGHTGTMRLFFAVWP